MDGAVGAASFCYADQEDEVGESEEGEGDPEIEEEVVVEGGAVSGGVYREVPEALADGRGGHEVIVVVASGGAAASKIPRFFAALRMRGF